LVTGKVKFYNSERRFGYIQQDQSKEQFRILGSALARAGIKRLSEGQSVNFDTHTDPTSGRQVVDTIEISQHRDRT
jgi:cold shock CspA family protein